LFGQSIERQVIGSAGTVFSNNNISMSFTVGETMVSSYNNGSHWLTEGFQQGLFDPISSVDQVDFIDIGVSLYPNPFMENFNLVFEEGEAQDFDVIVLNMLGEMVNVNRINMGQKVNPIGLRLSLNKKWQSKWFANKQDFGKFLQEDIKIRNFLNSSLKKCGVAKIEIERPAKKPQITIFTARPGLIIGKKVVILKNSKRKYLLLQDKMFRSILLK
jgi:hypothetical protein